MKSRNKTISNSIFGAVIAIFLLGIFSFGADAATVGKDQSATTTLSAVTSSTTQILVTRTSSSTLLFLGNQNIAPVIFLEDSVPTGVVVDITNALAPYLSRPIEIRAMDWPTAQKLVTDGNADVLMQINQTEERKKIYDFSDPLLESQFSIFVRTDRVGVSGLSSLHGLKVGVEKGGLPEQTLSIHPEIKLVIISNFLDGFKQLSDGVIDAVVVDYRVGSYTLAKNNIQGIRATGEPLAFSNSAFAVKKGNIKLLNEINAALKKIRTNGMYEAILTKWQPTETVFQTQEQITREILIAVISILSVLFILVIVWSITINRELSKRKKVEKTLHQSEEKNRTLLQKIQAAVVVHGADSRILSSNVAAQELLGLTEDQMIGKASIDPVWNFFHEDGRVVNSDEYPVSLVLSSRKPLHNYILRVHRSTKKNDAWVLVNADPVIDESNELTQVIITFVDITESRKEEENIKQLSQRNELILNSAGEGIYGTDVNGDITFVNASASKILGYTVSEMMGKNSHSLFHHTKADGSPYPIEECPLYKALKQRKIYRGEDEIFWTKDGKKFNVENVNAPLISDDKIIGSVVVFKDITERKENEDRLKELDKLKDDFLMVTTHELKTPLVPIKSQCQLLLAGDYGKVNEKQKEALEMIYRNGEFLNKLASEVMDIAKIKSNKMRIIRAPGRIEKIASNVVADMGVIAQRKHITLTLVTSPELPEIFIDESRIREVLANLIDNAIKFTPEGGAVKIEIQKKEDTISVIISDTGIGISSDNIPKLFEPFFRVESDVTHKQRGTGLGLAVSKGLIESHGGTIKVESKGEGKGSAFTITLPIAKGG